MPVLNLVVPDSLGEVDECVVVTWLKREGDTVAADETIVILQASKTAIELPAPLAGQVIHILAQQGDIVRKGQALAQLEVAEVSPKPAPPSVEPPALTADPGAARASPIAQRVANEHGVDLSQVTGSGAHGRITEKDVLAFVETHPRAAPAREVVASPAAKRLAREQRVDLADVTGSGEGGRITEKDVQAFIKAQGIGEAEPTPASPTASGVIPLAGTRAIIARRMHESLHTMAQVTLHTEADVTDLVRLYERVKARFPVTYTDLVVRASALALRQHPRLNAVLDGEVIRLIPDIHIGIAVALDDGLIVPVARNADRHSLAELSAVRSRLAERARAGQLSPAEVSGGTFTVTNLGGFDIDGFTPIINPPEMAILGVGRIVEKLVIHQAKVAQRSTMTLSLTFDHRLVDGAPAAGFLQTIKRLLEAPEKLE